MATTNRLDPVTIIVLFVGAPLLLPWLTMGLGFGGMMGYGGMMGGYGGSTGLWPLIGSLVQIAILLALLGGGYLLIKRNTADEAANSSAIAELRLAYARGDLTDEEFERRQGTLERLESGR